MISIDIINNNATYVFIIITLTLLDDKSLFKLGAVMSVINLLLVVIGVIIFISSLLSGGLLFNWGSYGYFAWFIGLILVAIGLWRNDKESRLNNANHLYHNHQVIMLQMLYDRFEF